MNKVQDGIIMTAVVCFILAVGILIGVAADRYTAWHKQAVLSVEVLAAQKAFYDLQFEKLKEVKP
jgi:hypothetical protein